MSAYANKIKQRIEKLEEDNMYLEDIVVFYEELIKVSLFSMGWNYPGACLYIDEEKLKEIDQLKREDLIEILSQYYDRHVDRVMRNEGVK